MNSTSRRCSLHNAPFAFSLLNNICTSLMALHTLLCIFFGFTLVLYIMYQILFFEVHRSTWKVLAHNVFAHAHFAASKICLNLVDMTYSIRLLSYLFLFYLSTHIFTTRLDGSR